MRIITGSAKGAKLKAPRGMSTRPTADRVKESVFNILGSIVENARVLDLFAGTGNLGLEALSRGADHAVFVDADSQCVRIIHDNLIHTRLVAKSEVFKCDVFQAVDKIARLGLKFDLVFCDPPYNQGLVASVLNRLDNSAVLSAGGIVVIEHSKHENVAAELQWLELKRSERYGETRMSFFRYNHGDI